MCAASTSADRPKNTNRSVPLGLVSLQNRQSQKSAIAGTQRSKAPCCADRVDAEPFAWLLPKLHFAHRQAVALEQSGDFGRRRQRLLSH